MKELISTEVTQKLKGSYEKVIEKLKSLEEITASNYRTSCRFRYNPSNEYSSVNIDQTQDISTLIHVFAFLMRKGEDYDVAGKELGLTTYPVFKWLGYKVEDWKSDIILRIKIITHQDTKNKLEKWKNKLEDFLSEEDKINNMLEEMVGDIPF